MPKSIFISYRRLDSQHATFAIADRLRWAFGADEVFFDRGSIRSGNEWPESLRQGLEAAKVLIVVMGRSWLTTADEWGRRRIDDENDWVRREIRTGLMGHAVGGKAIIPVLLSGASRLRAEALDTSLKKLAEFEAALLNDDNWENGLDALITSVSQSIGISRIALGDRNPNGSPARPLKTQANQSPLTDAEVRTGLEPLARWQLQRGPHPWGIGGQAQEITKGYDFSSFSDAVAFMAEAAVKIEQWNPPHHPRWENQWKVVNVWFSTWDVDCRVTKLDIDAAKTLDAIYFEWTRRRT